MFQSHRPLYLVVGLLAASLLLVACDDDPVSDDPEDPEPSVTASFTIDPDEPEIGDEVTLDASNSSAQNAGDLSFEWSLTAPSGSDASLADTGAEVTTFTADVEGDYDVALEVSANGASDNNNQSVTALETAGVVELSSSIDEDRTLNAETLYLVTSRIDINALLTVEPGTQIEFERDTYFQINSDGALDASGTEADPIVFTSVQPGDTRIEPGFWNGLFFESSERIENTLDHVIVEYGGGEGLGFRNDVGANVTVARSGSDARVAITNTTLRHSGGHGLRMYHSGELLDFSNNELTENEVAAASLFPTNAHQIDGSSTYTGNTNDVVEIDERAVDTSEIAWKALDVPYQMNGHIRIEEDTDLTIEPGAEFHFERGGQLTFNDESVARIEGTEEDPIVFTSVQPGDTREPGFWNGLFFQSTERAENILDHVVVEYGGGEGLGFRNDVGANVTVARSGSDAHVAITNTTLRHSGEYGLRVYHSGELLDFSNNELTENEAAAASLFATSIHQIDGSSTYTGNTNDAVEVEDREVEAGAITWDVLDVPYQMSSNTEINGDTDLTIEPGAEFHFESGGQLTFNDESVARIEGTEEDPIVFTSVQPGDTREPGFWNGLFFQSTERAENILDHAVVEYGGNESVGFRTDPANVTVARNGRDARLTITNTTLRESGGYGLFVHSNGTINSDWRDANTFDRNADGPGGGGGTD